MDDVGLPTLDEEAKASYRRRLAEVEDDIAEAQRNHDDARRELAERDRDYLVAELTPPSASVVARERPVAPRSVLAVP